MSNQLAICEKPSAARAIAQTLGATERGDGYFSGNGYIITWCYGHLVELATPEAYGEQYARWNYTDLPIVPETWKYRVPKDKAKQLKVLSVLMKRDDVRHVINCCDAGREGEMIFRMAYAYNQCAKPVKRLWISSMEDTAIREGFKNLKDGQAYDNLYESALRRSQADWLVGLNMTRLVSVLYRAVLPVGRVQSPTLAMLTEREASISSFTKEPFYTPELDFGGFKASGERQSDKDMAESIKADCEGMTATVTSVDRQVKTIPPPKLYDLTALQRDANRLLGFTAKQTLDYMQSLYEKKLCSYPRTDSRHLTEDMSGAAEGIIGWIIGNMGFDIDFVPDTAKVISGKDVTDHHAIIPTMELAKTDISALPIGEQNILNLITCRLLCAVAPAHEYEAATVTLECGGHSFTAKGRTIIAGGWRSVDDAFKARLKEKPVDSEDDSAALPDYIKGQIIQPERISVKEGTTAPPKRYTDGTLLAAMESAGAEDMPEDAGRRGLGTPATRAGIIEKLIKAGYAERQNKNLVPTEKGISLISILPGALTSPKLTAEWEHRLKQIEHGEIGGGKFMSDITEMTKQLVKENNKAKPDMEPALAKYEKQPESEPLGICPRCGGPVREGGKGFFCGSRPCGFKIWKESRFWAAKRKPLTAGIVSELLKNGKAPVKGLYSEKTGKTYDATVALEDTGGKHVNFRLEFNERKD